MEGYVRQAIADLDTTGIEYSEDEVIKLACDYEAEDQEYTLSKVAEAEDQGRIMAQGFMDEIEKLGFRMRNPFAGIKIRNPIHRPPPPVAVEETSRLVRIGNKVYERVSSGARTAYDKARAGAKAAYSGTKRGAEYTYRQGKAGAEYGYKKAREHPYVTGATLGIGGTGLYRRVSDD